MSARDPSGAGPGPSQGTRGGKTDKDRTGTSARDPSGAGPGPTQSGSVTDHSVTGGSAGKTTASGSPGGGGTTQLTPTPGAVPNFPDADSLTVAEKIFGPLIPGVGSSLGLATVAKAVDDGEFGGTVLGGDPGPQRGYQPDRYRGQASLGGIGGDGGAVNSGDEREIAGQRFGAGTMALTGDSETSIGGDGTGEYSDDIMLRDRRKPRGVGAGTQMLLG